MKIHLIGPGGAGKTTTAKLLALQLGYDCFDLDQYFMQTVGDISTFIDQFGYEQYAQKNIECYFNLIEHIDRNSTSAIIACSSGLMTYSENIHMNYLELKKQILQHPFTFVLLPSLCFKTCVQVIVTRQMNRPYLKTSPDKERDKITQRFYMYSQLACKIILTDVQPMCVVNRIKTQLDQ